MVPRKCSMCLFTGSVTQVGCFMFLEVVRDVVTVL